MFSFGWNIFVFVFQLFDGMCRTRAFFFLSHECIVEIRHLVGASSTNSQIYQNFEVINR